MRSKVRGIRPTVRSFVPCGGSKASKLWKQRRNGQNGNETVLTWPKVESIVWKILARTKVVSTRGTFDFCPLPRLCIPVLREPMRPFRLAEILPERGIHQYDTHILCFSTNVLHTILNSGGTGFAFRGSPSRRGAIAKIIRPRISRVDAVPASELHYRIVTSDPVECKDWDLRWDLVL